MSDAAVRKAHAALAQYLMVHGKEEIITNALEYYARRMREEAAVAREHYEAGQADPAVKAQQDTSMVTNEAFRMAAEMFGDSAWRAEEAGNTLRSLIADVRNAE